MRTIRCKPANERKGIVPRILQVAVAAAVVAVTATPGIVAAKPPQAKHADTVLRNGFVYTVDEKRSVKQAVALKDGVVTYVGNEGGVKRFIGPETEVIDVRGRMVMPGLQDGHVHAAGGGNTFFGCHLQNQTLTVPETLAIIQGCLDETADREEPDGLLVVRGFYAEATLPHGTVWHKSDLDSLDTERPVHLISRDGHNSLVNSRALELAGITAETPDPPNGRIDKDENGEPTGWLADAARNALRAGPTAPPPLPPPPAGEVRRLALKEMNAQGVTTFRDASTNLGSLREWDAVRVEGDLTARMFGSPGVSAEAATNNASGVVADIGAIAQEFPVAPSVEPNVQVVNVKIFNDGIHLFPGQTASLLEPYWVNHGTAEEPDWGPGIHNVDPFVPLEVLKNITLRLAEEVGVGSHIHAIGDRAVRETLDAFEHVRENATNDSVSLSIAHAEMVDPADYGRFAELNVSPVMSFQWAKPGPNMIEALENYIGPERHARVEPIGHLQAAGANVVYGSDWPVDPLDLWHAMQVSITRMAKPSDEHYRAMGSLGDVPGLTTAEAIEAFTINAARDLGHDSTTGSIEEGKFADLIVVDRNLFCASPDELAETEVLLTMVGGRTVHGDAESLSDLANVKERKCIAELNKEEAKTK
jgi:predicted amidohydrolase YtcJ